ncbi:MAG: hypothetical protein DCF20_18765 [Pseudanabaena sp.]|nr:MAG: hypothetical protein DCF20_18765 [Pseudanabaena sp.]
MLCQQCGCELLIDRAYAVKRLLSDKSGFGTIYEVEDANQHPKVLKILKPELNDQQKTVELFEKEAFLFGQIDFMGLPKIDAYIHHYLPDRKMIYGIVMEKIEGINLHDWNYTYKKLSEQMAMGWMRQIVRVLQIVHQKGYFHTTDKASAEKLQSHMDRISDRTYGINWICDRYFESNYPFADSVDRNHRSTKMISREKHIKKNMLLSKIFIFKELLLNTLKINIVIYLI